MVLSSRTLLRVQRDLLRCYEIFLFALLLALFALAAWPAPRTQAPDLPQCGKNQSSPPVMTR